MQVRHWLSVLSVFALAATVGLAGDPYRGHYGGDCKGGKDGAESQGGVNGDGKIDISDPIYLATGDFQHVQTDLVIPGRGMDFEIKRFYRSKSGMFARESTGWMNTERGVMNAYPVDHPSVGMNWDFNYNMRVFVGGDQSDNSPYVTVPQPTGQYAMHNMTGRSEPIIVFLGNGRVEDFYTDCSSSGDSSGVTPVLCEYTNEIYDKVIEFTHTAMPVILRDSDNTEYVFFPSYDHDFNTGTRTEFEYGGRLAYIRDRNGNTISFTYETSAGGEDRIAYAIDTLGHQIDFFYHDDSASPINSPELGAVIWQIVDHAGRVVDYTYTDTGGFARYAKMSKVTLPSIMASPEFPLLYVEGADIINHGRFPNGRTWEYEYDSVATGVLPQGFMTKMTDPNGVVILENEYDSEPIPAEFDHRTFRRVTRQVYAGDAYNYIATTTEGNTDFWNGYYLRWAQDYYVWVNDRRGAITRFKYSKMYENIVDVPGAPDQPRHLQLLEKVEYLGFVDNPDQQVWAECDAQGNPTTWYTFDSSGNEIPLTGTLPGTGISRTWTPNRRWNNERVYEPNLDYTETVFDDDSDNPLRWKTILSKTRYSADGQNSISEQWHYGFDFAGCGCGGSQGYATGYRDGNGNVTFKVYDTATNPITGRPSGNMLKMYRGLPPESSIDPTESYAQANAVAVDEYTYNQWGQIVTHTHPGKIILDAQGGEVVHYRVDQFDYYSDQEGPMRRGRLQKVRIDVNGFDLTTIYDYDLIGNMIKEIGPDGDVTEYLYNQASQLVRVEHFDHAQNLFAEKMYFYDANGNMVVEEEKNLDGDQTPVTSNKWFTTVHAFDELGTQVEISSEKNTVTGRFSSYTGTGLWAISQVLNADYASQRLTYDAHRNLVKFENGEAVNGNQANNIVTHEYDARDLRIRSTQGAGDVSPLVTAYGYDENDRLVTQTVNPDDMANSQTSFYTSDWVDRIIEIFDSIGNEYFYTFDNNNNVLSAVACGPILEDDDSGSQAQVTLAKYSQSYDTLNRKVSRSFENFDYDYATGNGEMCGDIPTHSVPQIANYIYNADSSIHEISVPSGNNLIPDVSEFFYDTVCRMEFYMDGAGNTSAYEYDSRSNIEKITQSDISTGTTPVVESYEVSFVFDALNRQIKMFDGIANQTFYKLDSRSNVVQITDPRGNPTDFTYDNLGRQVSSETTMTDTGDGNGIQLPGSSGVITVLRAFDDSNRIIEETDDSGNQTAYAYDGLGRMTMVTMPDSATYLSTYDLYGNPASYTDARGVVISMGFDRKNRLSSRSINDSAVPGGIPGAKQETFTYDGLGRMRTARNEMVEVARQYDSSSNVVKEIQNADAASSFSSTYDRSTSYGFDLAGNNTSLVYPGGRQIFRTYDELNRLEGIFNDAGLTVPITEFEYIGMRPSARIHGNGLQTAYAYNGHGGSSNGSNDFGFGRVNEITTSKVSTSEVVDAFTFTWDQNQNRTTYKDTGSDMKNRRERTFGYDSANRLISTDVDFPDPLTDFTAPTNNGITAYTLDGVHNRTSVSGFEGSGAPIGIYSQTGNQAANNQYSLTPREAGGEWSYVYDENGNMIIKAQNSAVDYNGDYMVSFFDMSAFNTAYANGDMAADHNGDGVLNFFDISAFLQDFNPASGTELEHWSYTYDFRNQLVGISQALGATVLSTTTNTYDPLARRVIETTDAFSKQMVYGGVSHWEILEQIDLAVPEQTLTTHVYGLGIDDEVSYRLMDLAIQEDIWSHRDDLNSLTSISDANGDILERYEYGDYGQVQMFDDVGLAITVSAYSAQHLYTGRLLISGSGLYDYRNRAMDSSTGRFVQQDPLGYIDSMNLYIYAKSNPTVYTDPMGEVVIIVGGVVVSAVAITAAAATAGISAYACVRTPACRAAAARMARRANSVRGAPGRAINNAAKKLGWWLLAQSVDQAAKHAARRATKKLVKCKALHTAYDKIPDCLKCKGTDSPIILASKLACITAKMNGRLAYMKEGCDLVMPGSIRRGVANSIKGHNDQIDQLVTQAANCAKFMGGNCR